MFTSLADLLLSPRVWWTARTRAEQAHVVLLGLLLAVHGYLQYQLWHWNVEDAAISYAFARNWAEGYGLVAFPGGERIEGYSNPLWVLLLAAAEGIGVSAWTAGRWLGLLFGLFPVGLVWLILRQVRGRVDAIPLLGAALVATQAQHVIWSASGLENGLFNTLLAAGIWRTFADLDDDSPPYAALAWLGLAVTRPEGILYAALGGLSSLVLVVSRGRSLGYIGRWLLLFFTPFIAYHLARFSYFAWEFPATYYAKLGEFHFNLYHWNARSWMYLRRWVAEVGVGPAIPLVVMGAGAARGWRSVGVVMLALGTAALLVPGSDWGATLGLGEASTALIEWRILWLVALPFVLGGLSVGQRHVALRAVALLLGTAAVAFSVRTGGDWMRGFRWLAMAAVPMSLMLALALADIGAWLSRFRQSWMPVVALTLQLCLVAVPVAGSLSYLSQYNPETAPSSVRKRTDYYAQLMKRLHIEHALAFDHDMGAMMWWGPDHRIRVVDTRGLVDMGFAQWHRKPRFVKEYSFEQHDFDLAHGHASTRSALARHDAWSDRYIEVPGYGGRTLHTGNFVARRLLMKPEWTGRKDRKVRFANGVEVYGPLVPSRTVAERSFVYVEAGVRLGKKTDPTGLRLLLVAHDARGNVHAWDLPLGYDDWLPPEQWQQGEVFHGRFSLPIGRSLPEGDYSLGFALLGPDGVIEATKLNGDALDPQRKRWYAEGEVFVPGAKLTVGTREQMEAAAAEDLAASKKNAQQGNCNRAVRFWDMARYHRVRSDQWSDQHRPAAARWISRCFASRAQKQQKPEAATRDIEQARLWDVDEPMVWTIGAQLADREVAKGLAAMEAQQWQPAFDAFWRALRSDPSRAWARRWLEQAREQRLGLQDPPSIRRAKGSKAGTKSGKVKAPPGMPKAGKTKSKSKAR